MPPVIHFAIIDEKLFASFRQVCGPLMTHPAPADRRYSELQAAVWKQSHPRFKFHQFTRYVSTISTLSHEASGRFLPRVLPEVEPLHF
jgi:hypothetical protein